jgi:hypothetical protein
MEWSKETMLPVCEKVLPWIHKQPHDNVLELYTYLSFTGAEGYRMYTHHRNLCTLEDSRIADRLTVAGHSSRGGGFCCRNWVASELPRWYLPLFHSFTWFLAADFCRVYRSSLLWQRKPLDENMRYEKLSYRSIILSIPNCCQATTQSTHSTE